MFPEPTDTKNHLADMQTKGNFTRDEWNHLLCLFNSSHFSSAECSEVMSKRTQKDSGEERITAKSEPMTNLVSRCSERTPDVLASTASESPGKTRHESQSPLSQQAEKYDRTGRPAVCAHSSSYSEWNVDKTWSSQEWKSDELIDDRTGRPVVCSQRASQTRFSRECKNVILEEEENHDRTGRPVVCSQSERSMLAGFAGDHAIRAVFLMIGGRPMIFGERINSLLKTTRQKADTQSFEPRVHCPEGQLKSKGGGKLSIHYCADQETIKTVFRTITSVNQLSLYGAVAEMCEKI